MVPVREHACFRPAAFIAAAIFLGHALQIRAGLYQPWAIVFLSLAVALVLAGMLLNNSRLAAYCGTGMLAAFLLAGLAWQWISLSTSPPLDNVTLASFGDYAPFLVGLFFLAAAIIGLANSSVRLNHAAFVLLLATYLFMGVWVIRTSVLRSPFHMPFIDVYVFQRDASDRLLQGGNPYDMTFEDIYLHKPGGGPVVYGDGLSKEGRVQFGFPYMPLSLFLELPGHLLGDHRYSQLAAMLLTALLLALANPGRIARLMAALLLLTPRGFYVLESSWSEPLVVLLLALTLFFACRVHRLLFVALGLLLAVKQYMILAVPCTLLLMPRPLGWRGILRLWLPAVAVAMLVSLPLMLWNFPAFWHSAAILQFHQPFRDDALSYLALVYRLTGWQPGTTVTLIAIFSAGLLVILRLRPSSPSFAAALAVVFLLFFAFNKQAFCNYYYFVIGAICCTAAMAPETETGKSPALPQPSVTTPT